MRKNIRKHKDMTATPSKYPQGNFKDKPCGICEEMFSPMAPSQKYCSDHCKDDAYADTYYKRTYGISLKMFKEILQVQNGVCAICNETGFRMHEGIKETLVVDHCHSTGKVRGLLCNNCNRALGLFKDDVTRLDTAIAYLKSATTIRKE